MCKNYANEASGRLSRKAQLHVIFVTHVCRLKILRESSFFLTHSSGDHAGVDMLMAKITHKSIKKISVIII